VADTNGSNTQLLFTHASGPSWSPDKKRLFFFGEQGVTQQQREGQVGCSFGTISDGLVAIDVMSPLRDICAVQGGEWFCERKRVDLQSEPSDVCTAGGISIYQNLDWKVGSARWAAASPDGEAIAFDAKPGGDYRIYFRAMLGASQQFRFELVGEQGAWSPDGQKMVYRSGRDNKAGLWISNRDDSGHTNITNEGSDSFPAWSPDGRTIAFSRKTYGNIDIYTINIDGTGLTRLTEHPGHDTLPVYTPDGDLVFRSDRSGSWGIWKMSRSGGGQTEIIPNAGVGPDWAYSKMDVR
jgi:Tol biopolymer transport system component